MAKSPYASASAKTKKAEKKRKSATPAPKESEDAVLGEISIPVQCSVVANNVFDELVIEWGCLGLSEEPDKISESSGNARLLDPDRPAATDDEGLHVFFKPAQPAGRYGFQFVLTYNSSVEARMADPEKVKKLEESREKFESSNSEA